MSRLGWQTRPQHLHELQAAAAVGQMGLVQTWEAQFKRHDIHTAQILLTHDDLSDRKRYLNGRSALRSLLDGVVPIVNENDTVVTDEIRFGDNDTLGALVANLIEADGLIILTDQLGLFVKTPVNTKTELVTGIAEDRTWMPWPAAVLSAGVVACLQTRRHGWPPLRCLYRDCGWSHRAATPVGAM